MAKTKYHIKINYKGELTEYYNHANSAGHALTQAVAKLTNNMHLRTVSTIYNYILNTPGSYEIREVKPNGPTT